MREIKFRAWDKYEKEMFYGMNKCLMNWDGLEHNVNRFFDGNIPIMQYTGLKDKNGKEIYEGDVVTFLLVDYDTGKERMMTWEIKWIDDEALFGMRAKSGDELLMDVNLQHLEIIGNIYENPDLASK